ncbi:TPM domain-containing protein [Aurantimonas sp. A3-2-R12]|uniref:TPM domain-containing protein n=1 Tax=Aurantimonas sp. A3-2-R12 TaxID=3114362 RepID=UPI002E16C442|nr:TPM domain-containing protein [Aurantimonas sp. A3-2-R12]
MAHLSFTEADHARIAAAISAAEATTTGEIYAVFARTSDAYVFVPATIALALSLVAALLAALFAPLAGFAISGLALVTSQLAATLALLALFALVPRLRMVFVPRAVAEDPAHRMALSQFFAHNIHTTVGRTGVLVFVSEAERYAEIVADAEIAAKVPQEAWDAIVADLIAAARDNRLADGYVQAVTAAGAILTAHFPGDHANPNEIDDRLVEI